GRDRDGTGERDDEGGAHDAPPAWSAHLRDCRVVDQRGLTHECALRAEKEDEERVDDGELPERVGGARDRGERDQGEVRDAVEPLIRDRQMPRADAKAHAAANCSSRSHFTMKAATNRVFTTAKAMY